MLKGPNNSTGLPTRLAIVIPAAGVSQRLGQPKQRLPCHHTTLLGHAIETALAFSASTTELHDIKPVVISNTSTSSEPPPALEPQIVRSLNDKPERGLRYSLQCSATLTSNSTAVLVLLADQYRVSPNDLRQLYRFWSEEPQCVAVAQYGRQLGPPVVWPQDLWQKLLNSDDPRAGQTLLHNHHARRFPLSNAAFDVDSPEDLIAYKQWQSPK